MDNFETKEDFDEFLKSHYNTSLSVRGENIWNVDIEGDANSYRITVSWEDENIYLSIKNYGLSPRNPKCALRLYEYLLHANREMQWTFFSIDENLAPYLMISIPSSGFSPETVKRAVDYLVYYGDLNYFNIINLANDERAQIIQEDDDY
ncbi:MAG: hypothetical protein JXR95_04995 [Deltaproteobacteria bacterium]|nr:hypothetical protein [Deltaproteobacteria bacterium]